MSYTNAGISYASVAESNAIVEKAKSKGKIVVDNLVSNVIIQTCNGNIRKYQINRIVKESEYRMYKRDAINKRLRSKLIAKKTATVDQQ